MFFERCYLNLIPDIFNENLQNADIWKFLLNLSDQVFHNLIAKDREV